MKLLFIFMILTFLCASIMAQEYTADYWLQKGDEFYINNSYGLALRCYEKAIEINPLNADAWHNKGDVLNELNRTTEADAAFSKATELSASTTSDTSSTSESNASQAEVSVSSLTSTSEPTYFDHVSADQAGSDGITCQFTLADDNTNEVASDGIFQLEVVNEEYDEEIGVKYLDKTIEVKSSDFRIGTTPLRPNNPLPFFQTGRLVLDSRPSPGKRIVAYFTFTTPEGRVLTDNAFVSYWK
jgi:tetratricopeptide (TPR) repeat protein